MTNFSRGFALKCALAALAAALAGCGPGDGSKDCREGIAAYEAHDLKKAERSLEKGLRLAPGNVDALVTLAQVKLDLGELAAATAAIEQAGQLAPEDIDVRLLAAQIAWHSKDYDRAASLFSAIAADGALSPELRSQGFAGLGVVEVTRENTDLARIAFMKAIRLDRRNAAAWYHLGFVYRDGMNYLDAALEQFNVFVRLEAEASPRVQKTLYTVIPNLKAAIAEAASNLPGAANRDSAAASSLIAKAEAALKKGGAKNLKAALGSYQSALKADALSYPAALGLAKTWQKVDTTARGQQNAYDAYMRACKLNASAVSTYLATGAMAMKLKRYAESAAVYSRALAANPASLEAADGLIRALRKAGKANLASAYQQYRDMMSKPKRK